MRSETSSWFFSALNARSALARSRFSPDETRLSVGTSGSKKTRALIISRSDGLFENERMRLTGFVSAAWVGRFAGNFLALLVAAAFPGRGHRQLRQGHVCQRHRCRTQ